MNAAPFFLLAADAILLLHILFVAFVVIGLALILIGRALFRSLVRNPWFRLTHLASICVVVVQSWAGAMCPLTIAENGLRSRAGAAVYPGSFISRWLETILYYQAPEWVFIVCYTTFGILVLASWFWVRPRSFFNWRKKELRLG